MKFRVSTDWRRSIKSFVRYPGAKSRHTDKILQYFQINESEYREPFIGGGSVFLASSFTQGWINDIDPAIYDLWRLVKESPETLTNLIKEHTIILDHQKSPKKIEAALNLWKTIRDGEGDYPEGYRALFLIKTCFSGIKSGGPTGGMHQTGKYNLTSRWSPEMTISRINAVHNRLQGVRITKLNYEELVIEAGQDVAIYFDPPYLKKGDQCYDFYFTLEDHEKFAKTVVVCPHRYVVTLDDCEELRDIWSNLVPNHLILSEEWSYSMSDYREENRVGKEMFIVDQRSYDLGISRRPRQKAQREYD